MPRLQSKGAFPMNPHDLNRAVARATGETVREISQRGFVLLTWGSEEYAPRDCNEGAREHERPVLEPVRRHEPALVF